MPRCWCAISRPRKRKRDLDLVAFVEEALHRPHLHVVIVIVDGRAHLDLLDLDDLLLLAGFVGLLLLLVFVFAVVEQFADRRLVVGGDLDQIEAFLFRDGAGFVGADLAIFVPVVADQKHGAGGDLFIDARAILGGRGRILLKTSGDYDLFSFGKPCAIALRRFRRTQAKRGSIMDANGGLSMTRRVALNPAEGRTRRKIGCPGLSGKGYSATSWRDSASVLMRAMNCSSGMAPKSLPDLQPDRDFSFRRLALAHHQHVGDFLELGVADLLLHPLVGGVDVHAQAGGAVDHRRGKQGVNAPSARNRSPSR